MDLTRLTLDTVKLIREQPRPEHVKSPEKAVPHAPLLFVVRELGIEGSAFYTLHTAGRSAEKKRLRRRMPDWHVLEKLKAAQDEAAPSWLVLDVARGPGVGRSATFPIGFLAFYRKVPFSDAEIAALADVAGFLGDYMYDVLRASHTYYCDRARQRIETRHSEPLLPGTLLHHDQGVVHRAMRAYASYFCVVDSGRLIVDYYQKPTWNRPRHLENPPTLAVKDPAFQAALEEKDIFLWVDSRAKEGIGLLLRSVLDFDGDDWLYLVGSVKSDHEPIAAWVFQFRQGQAWFPDLFFQMLADTIEFGRVSINYLYQKRTKKLVVDPIFRSRETRVERDLAFVLMPFTEPWSERIWGRILRTIIADEGLTPLRADDLYGRDIMEDIWSSILKARIVVADITGRNPNVFYELGLAHSVGKDVILLTQSVDDIPFDLNRYRHIVYEDNLDGYETLESQLRSSLRDVVRPT